jgi:hypothetical protein
MARKQGSAMSPGAPMKVPAPGATSSVGKKPPVLTNPVKPTAAVRPANTRDYGKPDPAPAPMSSPNPFGPTMGGM